MSGKAFWAFLLLFSISNACVVWITLLSREPSSREIYLIPFYSYYKGFNGNKQILIENIENILLFVPFGFFLSILIGERKKTIILSGFLCSLAIEIVQWITGLGSFEVDDLIHNTIGSGIGLGIASLLKLNKWDIRKKTVLYISLTSLLFILIAVVGKTMYEKWLSGYMVEFAAKNDRDNSKNLLILNGKSGYASNSDVYIKYNSDGSISIKGSSENRSWYVIGDLSLDEGTYVFTGMSGVDENTIAIELEYYNEEKDTYMRLIPDVGPIEEVEFILDKTTQIRAYVGVYPGGEYNSIARPAIFKQGE